ncbi:MAG: hypothetical protein HZA92_15410 [Verrucomicrobia bacterium]|nr:hypothetical protein [Verrucomicrobiota bacterium]
MPIPALDEHGLLPAGVHDCTLEEVRLRFGRFQGSDVRGRLFARLAELLSELMRSELVASVVVDGSFVTAKPSPNDVDLLIVLKADHDWTADLGAFDYGLVSSTRMRRRFGFDVLVAEDGSRLYQRFVKFFSGNRENPTAAKGVLRIRL